MNQQDSNLRLKKSSNFPNQRDKIKAKIMDKYNVSDDEAEKILCKIERKNRNKLHEKQSGKKLETEDSEFNKQILNRNKSSNMSFSQSISIKRNRDRFKQESKKNNLSRINYHKSSTNVDKKNDDVHLERNKSNSDILSYDNEYVDLEKNSKNVDSILSEVIPDYNQQISVDVNHVDLTFEVSNEKIDTLKESFIRIIKNNTSTKIKIHALKDVTFRIYKGEKIGIIGYNGAGKSTLLNVISGIYIPDKGQVSTYGKISPLLSLGAGFDFNYSGRKNIILNGAVLGYDKEYLESKIDEIIEFSELGEFIDIPVKNYSSGMIAKLAFSIAASVNPDILIIDEILGVGDVNFYKKSSDKIKSLMDGGTTVLLVSHSIPQIRELCDKAIWMENGSLRAFGDVNKVCDAYLKDAEKASNEQLKNIQLFYK